MNYCPKFTVIIPVYNVAAYLAKCIDSVLKQEFKQYEVILIDDGSTDESGTICDKFAEQDKRIVVIHQKNKGLSAARNIGIENAKGEYILFLDSDDYWHDSSALNIIYSRLNVSNADILSFNYMKFCDDVFEKPYFKQDTINEQISNFAQTYPTNLKASSNEALLFMRRYRFANCSCFSCCFKDAYPSSNVQ